MDSSTIRRENLKLLIAGAGSQIAAAEKLDKSQSQISNWIHARKGIGARAAREIETAFGKPMGWLDSPHFDHSTTVVERAAFASQSPRLSAATVVNTTQALRMLLGRRGIEYDPIDHATLFVAAYAEAEKLSESPSMEETVAFASVVTDMVQRQTGG